MSHPLQERITVVRRKARWLLLAYGASLLAAFTLLAALALGAADYAIRFQDPGVRIICSLALPAVFLWACYRFLLPSWRYRLDDVDVARRIEKRFPMLRGRLTSAVDFLKQSEEDRQAGSAAMRRRVIAETTADVENINLSEAVDRRATTRAATVLLAAGLAAVCVFIASPASASLALRRLVNPLGDHPWPRENNLVVERVERVALGQPFEVRVTDPGAKLPDDVQVLQRFEGDAGLEPPEALPLQRVGEAAVAIKENVTRPFEYRAVGGDHRSMEWIYVDVVEPPRIASLSIKLFPPAYTGWPAAKSERRISGLRGTRIEMQGATTKPVLSAVFKQENGPELPCEIADDGYAFRLPAKQPLVIERSGKYWFEFTDREEFVGQVEDRWDIQAIEDRPPAPVTIVQPEQDLYLVADAVVPLAASAQDDLALRSISLHYGSAENKPAGEIPLWQGGPKPPAQTADSILSGARSRDSRKVDYRWQLAALNLAAGDRISFEVQATDYQPAMGKSAGRKITIITADELMERLARLQNNILQELSGALKTQTDVRDQVGGLQKQLEGVGELRKADVDLLQGAERNQRDVTSSLTSPSQGARALIEGVRAELEMNHVDSPDIDRGLQELTEELDRLGRDHLPQAERELTSAVKDAVASKDGRESRADLNSRVAGASQHQDQVIQSLEGMVKQLSQWDNYRRFARDITQLRHEQSTIERDSLQMLSETLSKDPKDLGAQQQTDLKKLAGRQMELGRRFDRVQQRMQDMQSQLKESDPLAAEALADALHAARDQGLSGQMQQAAGKIEQNQIGQALPQQKQIGEQLQEILDTLANKKEHELGRLVKKLREAEQRLAELNKMQRGLRKKVAEAAAMKPEEQRRELERLARLQKKVEEEVARLSRELQRLQAEQAADSLAGAAGQMGQSAEAGQGGSAKQAGEKANEALDSLEQAAQELAERRRQAEQDLATEQLARIEDDIKGLVARQQRLLDETERLDKLREAVAWTRAQIQSLLELARQQRSFQAETGSLTAKLTGAPVFRLALERAGSDMSRAAALLDERETGENTKQQQRSALARLQELVAALDLGEGEAGSQDSGSGSGSQGGNEGGHDLAELKLLKLMQESVNRRTRELDAAVKRSTTVSDEQRRQFEELVAEQGRLADLVVNLRPAQGEPEGEEPLDDLEESLRKLEEAADGE